MSLKNQKNPLVTPIVFDLDWLKLIQAVTDILLLVLSFVVAYLLRFDFDLAQTDIWQIVIQISFVVPLQKLFLRLFGVHKFIWRYTSLRESRRILIALLAATVPILLLRLTFPTIYYRVAVPLSIIIFDFCLAAIGLLGIRILRREIDEQMRRYQTTNKDLNKKSVILIGAGRAGVMTLAEVKSRGDINLNVVGFVDDDKKKRGAVINGVKVFGGIELLPQLIGSFQVDHVIISIAQSSRKELQRILSLCQSIPIKVRTIPGLFELLQDKVTVSRIRDIEVEDLLGRSPIHLEESGRKSFLDKKIIMVTGAGGSIGSEIVRQLTYCQPAKLILVERSEFSLFQIEREIKVNFPEIDFEPIIADICDERRMKKVFERFDPQIVFHAAAHKHVPMMELNASEALKNNVLGTNTVGRLAGEHGAEAFVLISTDKAVNPSSIMGATKRVAELVIQDLNNYFTTRFVAVRFGNVIGSNGSVIPTFREQIRKGGPVTVTHPGMQRFFMTIPEATQLVLRAGGIGKGGEIFILDMGEPIRILDLANETIKLSGLQPGIDIQIKFTGMRPGEKLVEELETDKEQLAKTIHPKIFIGEISAYPTAKIREMISEINGLCISENNDEIRRFLSDSLPEAKLVGDFNMESTTCSKRADLNLNSINQQVKIITDFKYSNS